MGDIARASVGCALALVLAAGCSTNPLATQQMQSLQQQQVAANQRYQEAQSRASALDTDNQDLGTRLAQESQLRRVAQERAAALQEELATVTSQLAALREEQKQQEKERSVGEASMASTRRAAGATITANSSLRSQLPAADIAGVETRTDGDVIRIELPADRLFEPGSARLLPQAPALIADVAREIDNAYPQHIVGVEGHTDSDPLPPGRWASNHQLSVGRAMAVYDQLVSAVRFRPEQLFVVGHGANHPVVSNGTPAGKARNRRVELVIYPERASTR